ncbi:amino acid permease-associated protein [Candidatus Halobonum tyrrellensis G22]|uniref:Amino acid permease-associated protein n=2 Tax=Candidatus Halobonum TaxID=1431544 RepID=V4HFX5_9EURY|nr:amino acid permease-associated protein [Candidatus Halobonum tyrrellensis G22]
MIAAGIFSLSGTAVNQIGSSAVIAFVIAALVASITAATYSEFASIYSENGGGYLFTSETFEGNGLLTYAVGASLFLGYTGTTAFYLATMDEWFFMFIFPESLHVLPRGTVGIAAALLLGYLNARGTEESGTFQVVVTAAKVAILFVFIGGAVAYAGPSQAATTFASDFSTDAGGIVSIAALAFITFFGFSAIAASAGEIIEPRKTVPRAIAASIVTVTVLYTFVIIAMVNAPVSDSVLAQGETAMGQVAASFLGPVGQYLIVAGAVFSMISASNASVLAASGIGSLMGQNGHAPRAMGRIDPDYETPTYSVATATVLIAVLIFVFMTLFGQHGLLMGFVPGGEGGIFGFGLFVGGEEGLFGLEPLTGFATFNLLMPLAVVNAVLIYSRRNKPELDRGFSMPLVPYLPALGIVANVALVYMLPVIGTIIGVALTVVVVALYVGWGGAPAESDLVREASPERTVAVGGNASRSVGGSGPSTPEADVEPELDEVTGEGEEDRFRVLVPVRRMQDAPMYARLAARMGELYDEPTEVWFLNVTEIPEQTYSEQVFDVAQARVDRLEDVLAGVDDLDATFVVEGHVSRDIAFDVLKTTRETEADRILMGYPSQHYKLAHELEYGSPCDVLFVRGLGEGDVELSPLTIGTGGGPHHRALAELASRVARAGGDVTVVDVQPTGTSGTSEDTGPTLDPFDDGSTPDVVEVTSDSIADALVDAAADRGGLLAIGAARTRGLSRHVFGSTPDRVVARASERDVPVLVYASASGEFSRLSDLVFAPIRAVAKRVGWYETADRDTRGGDPRPGANRSDPGVDSDRSGSDSAGRTD